MAPNSAERANAPYRRRRRTSAQGAAHPRRRRTRDLPYWRERSGRGNPADPVAGGGDVTPTAHAHGDGRGAPGHAGGHRGHRVRALSCVIALRPRGQDHAHLDRDRRPAGLALDPVVRSIERRLRSAARSPWPGDRAGGRRRQPADRGVRTAGHPRGTRFTQRHPRRRVERLGELPVVGKQLQRGRRVGQGGRLAGGPALASCPTIPSRWCAHPRRARRCAGRLRHRARHRGAAARRAPPHPHWPVAWCPRPAAPASTAWPASSTAPSAGTSPAPCCWPRLTGMALFVGGLAIGVPLTPMVARVGRGHQPDPPDRWVPRRLGVRAARPHPLARHRPGLPDLLPRLAADREPRAAPHDRR